MSFFSTAAIESAFWILLWTVLILALICEAIGIHLLWKQSRKEKPLHPFISAAYLVNEAKRRQEILKEFYGNVAFDLVPKELTLAQKIRQSWKEFNRNGGLNEK
jgi:hypothetical protein